MLIDWVLQDLFASSGLEELVRQNASVMVVERDASVDETDFRVSREPVADDIVAEVEKCTAEPELVDFLEEMSKTEYRDFLVSVDVPEELEGWYAIANIYRVELRRGDFSVVGTDAKECIERWQFGDRIRFYVEINFGF